MIFYKKDIGHVTGGAADIKDEYEIINGIKYPKNTNSKEIEILKENAKKETKAIEKERAKEHIKNWSGAALELGSSAIPFSSGVKTVNILGKALTSKVGRKVAEEIVKQTEKGALSGGVFGLGEGLIEDKNLIKTASKDAAIGAVMGVTLSGTVEKISKNLKQNKLINTDFKNKVKLSNEYYKNYERGVKTERKDLGEIILSSDSFKETTKQNEKLSDKVINLSKDLKKAKYIGTEKPIHNHKYDIVQFHRLAGKDCDYLIAENAKGKYYFYKVVEKKKE